jgi:hypothetical protein
MPMNKFLLTLGILFVFTGIALAHSWYPADCCAGNDCTQIPCPELVKQGADYVYRGTVFTASKFRESMDNFCHACALDPKTGNVISPRCLFLPKGQV